MLGKNNQNQIIKLDEGWKVIQNGITKLKNLLDGEPSEKPFTSQEYMDVYTTIFNMCTQKAPHMYAKDLYGKYKKTFNEYLKYTVLPSLRDKYNEFLLSELVKRWNNHKIMIKSLSQFFRYLERYFIPQYSLPSLNNVALLCFFDVVFKPLNDKITAAIISLIHMEREGHQIDPLLVKNVVDMYVEIGMDHYEHGFEVHMLDDTSTYYARKATKWIEADSCLEYLLKVEESLKRERERAGEAGYLVSSTQHKLEKRVKHELLVSHATQLLEKGNSGFHALLRDDKVEDLSRIYKFFHEMQRLEPLVDIFRKHVIAEGTLVVQVEEASSSQTKDNGSSSVQEHGTVRKVIEFYDKYMAYIESCFMNDVLFFKPLKEAFDVICNKNVDGTSFAELLATFCDTILKKGSGSEKLSEEEIDETFDKVANLLVHNNDKDVFAEFYRKKLARRLLFDRSANEDHEKSFLCKLKQHFGAHYVSKIEGMMTDLAISKDTQLSYEQCLEKSPHLTPGIDFSVSVLTTGFWPTYKSFGINLPLEMVRCVELFKVFYESTKRSKKISWVFSLGSCNIIGNFQQKPIELTVSTYQAAALLLFNDVDGLSYSEIKTILDIDHDEDLCRILHSLSCAKYKILSKEPDTKKVSPNDVFKFNSSFTDRMRRIRLPLVPIDDRKKVVEDVNQDRRYTIDASIVRIMKSRKILGHQQLVSQCVEMLSRLFKPDVKDIKKRIDNLIGQDFLERDPNDLSTYKYVA